MRWRGLLGLALLAPLALIALGTLAAVVTGLVGAAQVAWGVHGRDSTGVIRGAATVQRAADVLDLSWSSPMVRLLEGNPVTLGAVDEVRASARALSEAAGALPALARTGSLVTGFDGEPPIVSGATIDTSRVAALADPVAEVGVALVATRAALDDVPRSGLAGRAFGSIADSLSSDLDDWSRLVNAAVVAMPDLPEALGAQEPQRYLVCALNDAELFGSGGAPLYALIVEAADGTLSVPLSGQLESKLSPNNPPIAWKKVGGKPWYQRSEEYPFVNSNFHPDFRTAAQDMARAWAALGYPEVSGVITMDVNALAGVLAEIGPVESPGYGRVTAENLVRKVLIDAYRRLDSVQGQAERHSWNDALVAALVTEISRPQNLLPVVRGVFAAIPPRHVQASFDLPGLEAAAGEVGAAGALATGPGDLIGAFTQSSPNKTSVFHDRTIVQDVTLSEDGGATVRRQVKYTNAVPPDADGDRSSWLGYSALRTRFRVAHRLPPDGRGVGLTTDDALAFGLRSRPYPDRRGGKVLWKGHEIGAGDTVSDTITYVLPPGTFAPNTYEAWADPQALTIPVTLVIRVTPAPGQALRTDPEWTQVGDAHVWSGSLDRPVHLQVG